MKKEMLLPIFLLFLLIFSTKVKADTYISECSNLNESETYYLTSDIIDSEDNICINIEADNIVLDCQQHYIDGYSLEGNGINVYSVQNITIKNCIITNWRYGIYISYSNVELENVVVNETRYGITVENSNNNLFLNVSVNLAWYDCIDVINSNNNTFLNLLSNECQYGIYLIESSNNTLSNIVAIDNSENNLVFDSSNFNNISNVVSNGGEESIFIQYSSNNVFSNMNINNNIYGIYMFESNNNLFLNILITESYYGGVDLVKPVSNNTFINMTIVGGWYGINFEGFNTSLKNSMLVNQSNCSIVLQSSDNTIYNNIFNNTNYVCILDSYFNYWNTTKQPGKRIYSYGNYIGGNYWTNLEGNGYSDTCTDSDRDGFCDEPYVLDDNNIDYLPLSNVLKCNDGEYRCSDSNLEVCVSGEWALYQECEYGCYEGECIAQVAKPFYKVIISLVLSIIPLIISISFILIPLGKILTEGISAENIIAVALAIIIGIAFLVIIVNSIM